MDEALKALDAQRSRWITAINQGSADGFVAVITEDAVWLPPGQPAISGRKAIRAWLERPFAELDYAYTVSEVRLRVAGAWAVEQARFCSRVRSKSGETLPEHRGRYTLVWRRTPAGEWLIERYIDHSAEFVEVG